MSYTFKELLELYQTGAAGLEECEGLLDQDIEEAYEKGYEESYRETVRKMSAHEDEFE